MKAIKLFFAFLLLSCFCNGQAPQLFNYQATARDASGNVLANKPIGLKISILDGSPTGTALYSETFTLTTNQFGLFTLAVGGGTVVSGNFSTITWGSGSKYLQTNMDPAGGTSYSLTGTSQLLSVPYALNASGGWSLTGNSGTTVNNFIGTTDNPILNFKVGNKFAGLIDTTLFNTFFGLHAGENNIGDINTSSGIGNSNFGDMAGEYNTTGELNANFGFQAGYAITTASSSSNFGCEAGRAITTGANNSNFGTGAGSFITTGKGNSNFGTAADELNVTGVNNSNFGNFTGFLTQGNSNSNFGSNAGYENDLGNGNSNFGDSTGGRNNSNGNYNTNLGMDAGESTYGLTNATAIGYDAQVGTSNTIVLGNPQVTDIYCNQNGTAILHANPTITSDIHKKENFLPVNAESILNKISKLPISSWNYKFNKKTERHYGAMAQDFYKAFGKDKYGIIGNDTTISLMDMNGVQMAAIQALAKRTEELKIENGQLKIDNGQLKANNEKIKGDIKKLQEQYAKTNETLNNKLALLEVQMSKLSLLVQNNNAGKTDLVIHESKK